MTERCCQAVALISSPFDMDAWVELMNARPARRVFTAPETGLYHLVAGWPPHHERDCDDRCPIRWKPR